MSRDGAVDVDAAHTTLASGFLDTYQHAWETSCAGSGRTSATSAYVMSTLAGDATVSAHTTFTWAPGKLP